MYIDKQLFVHELIYSCLNIKCRLVTLNLVGEIYHLLKCNNLEALI